MRTLLAFLLALLLPFLLALGAAFLLITGWLVQADTRPDVTGGAA